MKNVLSKLQKNNYDTPTFNGVSDKVRDFLLIMCMTNSNSQEFLLMQKYLNEHLGFKLTSRQHFKDLKTMRRFVFDTMQFAVDE